MVLNVGYISESCWIEVCKKVKTGVVFLDKNSGECLHWHGGLNRLIKAGASSIKNFSSFEGGGKDDKKAVFLVACPLLGPSRTILKDIISNSFFEHCILITPCSPIVFNLAVAGYDYAEKLDALDILEKDILQWMNYKDPTVEIFHSYSYGIVPLNDYFFVTPAFSNLLPCFDEDIHLIGQPGSKISDWELDMLPIDLGVKVMYLMSTLNRLLSQLSVREDIYCLGPFSNLLGSLIQKSSTSLLRAKTASSSMSLLLVDRTLDVCSPLSFQSDSLLDLMKHILPPFPDHTIDVAIDMSSLFGSSKVSHLLPPGCLHEPKGPTFDLLLSRTTPEILRYISSELISLSRSKERDYPLEELRKIIQDKFSTDIELLKDNSGLIQFSLGVIETLKSKTVEKTKLLRSSLMILLQVLASDGPDEAIKQITNLINKRHEKGLDIEHILYLLTYFYSFVGDTYEFNSDLEALLFAALTKAVLEDRGKTPEDSKIKLESIEDPGEFLISTSKKLKAMKTCRKHLFKYRDVTLYQDSMMPLGYQSVLTQLLQDVLNPVKAGIPDLRHKPNMSTKENLASRFSMLLNTTRTHITDSDSLMIFFIGGVTGHEVKTIKQFFKHFQKPVLIGSTSILSPTDLIQNLYFNEQSS